MIVAPWDLLKHASPDPILAWAPPLSPPAPVKQCPFKAGAEGLISPVENLQTDGTLTKSHRTLSIKAIHPGHQFVTVAAWLQEASGEVGEMSLLLPSMVQCRFLEVAGPVPANLFLQGQVEVPEVGGGLEESVEGGLKQRKAAGHQRMMVVIGGLGSHLVPSRNLDTTGPIEPPPGNIAEEEPTIAMLKVAAVSVEAAERLEVRRGQETVMSMETVGGSNA